MHKRLLKALHPQLPPLSLGLPFPGVCSHLGSVLPSGWCLAPLGGALSQVLGANKETDIPWSEGRPVPAWASEYPAPGSDVGVWL